MIIDPSNLAFHSFIRNFANKTNISMKKDIKIAVAGTGYVGMSIATLLSQHHDVTAVDIVEEKVDKINRRESPIVDKEIEEYLATKPLRLRATLDGAQAYRDAHFVVIAAPTNYDSHTQENRFEEHPLLT